jgi:photosystem II stability/assembly factor-like uncharacterized protein
MTVDSTLFVVMETELLVVTVDGSRCTTEVALNGRSPQCIAVDVNDPARMYCGTRRDGLWRSDDIGKSWSRVAKDVPYSNVTAVAVSSAHEGAHGAMFLGTQPSAIFRSADGGASWHECPGLVTLPSAATWSFPPSPETHHVRYIAIDPVDTRRFFVCIEAGALVRSLDSGDTWQDRTSGGPFDTHTLATHPLAPGRLYSAAGDGYFESDDSGGTWRRPETGLQHHYLWDIVVDPSDPDTIVVSAAHSARQAHDTRFAESVVYQKNGGHDWHPVEGLPPAKGTTVSALAASQHHDSVFYAANNHGLYRSGDAGLEWERVPIEWPDSYRSQRVRALAATGAVSRTKA